VSNAACSSPHPKAPRPGGAVASVACVCVIVPPEEVCQTQKDLTLTVVKRPVTQDLHLMGSGDTRCRHDVPQLS
jgi:hypothetical protein